MAMAATTEEYGGQTAMDGPGLERKYTTRITGSPPDGAKIKVKGAATVTWDGPQLDRGQRATLIVDVVCTGVALEDDTDADGYVKKTYRVHTTEAESVRMAEDWEAESLNKRRLRDTGKPEAMGEPPSGVVTSSVLTHERAAAQVAVFETLRSPEGVQALQEAVGPDVTVLVAPTRLQAHELVMGDQIVAPGDPDGELHLVWDILTSTSPDVVRLQLDSDEGSVLELARDEIITGALLPRDADGNASDADVARAIGEDPPQEEVIEEDLVTDPVPANPEVVPEEVEQADADEVADGMQEFEGDGIEKEGIEAPADGSEVELDGDGTGEMAPPIPEEAYPGGAKPIEADPDLEWDGEEEPTT